MKACTNSNKINSTPTSKEKINKNKYKYKEKMKITEAIFLNSHFVKIIFKKTQHISFKSYLTLYTLKSKIKRLVKKNMSRKGLTAEQNEQKI